MFQSIGLIELSIPDEQHHKGGERTATRARRALAPRSQGAARGTRKLDLDLNDLGRGWVRRNRAGIPQRLASGISQALRFPREVMFLLQKQAFPQTRISDALLLPSGILIS